MAALYRAIVPVDNIDIAVRFYSKVLETPGQRVSKGRHYFDCGGTILACYDPVRDGDPLTNRWSFHTNQYLYFAVNDLNQTLTAVEHAGGRVTAGIQSMPWGETILYAQDPFGTPIAFVDSSTVFMGGTFFD
ncbi:MAG: VOC family protein [Sulfobacillus benefaciens]|uniref:VOC family protein n=1 Tax=Sulfobacillus benefaciens TaxID=453960 RepID=A0A2T2WRJ2_9FIRM|nr:MAG: VOC family protein [Sulfobacillus benefaciens]